MPGPGAVRARLAPVPRRNPIFLFQWMILGQADPEAALVVGPVLITTPYAIARALANRVARLNEAPA